MSINHIALQVRNATVRPHIGPGLAPFVLSLILLPAIADHSQAAFPYFLLRQGIARLKKGDIPGARQFFERAAEQSAHDRDLQAASQYNRALAHYLEGNTNAALEGWHTSKRTADSRLQGLAAYDLGTVYTRQAQAAMSAGQLDTASKAIEQALKELRLALHADPRDREAKINYEIALKIREQLQQLQQAKARNQADEKEQPTKSQQEPSSQQSEKREQQAESEPQQRETGKAKAQQKTGSQAPQKREPQPSSATNHSQMKPEEAIRMLDMLREEEKAKRARVKLTLPGLEPVEKDW